MTDQVLPNLFRTEFARMVSVLSRHFGLQHVEVAEDLVSDTFLLASETWQKAGVPENPTAWLYAVAKNKTKDYLKRNQLFSKKIATEIKKGESQLYEIDVDLSHQNINDSQLQMMLALCHPAVPPEAQIGLALRLLCGFGIDEIADAFLTNKETINKRLFRAKEKLREDNIQMELPDTAEIPSRLEAVATTLYLVFNEGYHSSTQNIALRKDFCLEAMRLTLLLTEYEATRQPFVFALLALMCFHASRFEARTSATGELVLYEDQDRRLWNAELIQRGEYYLNQASVGNVISKYHLEAAIAYWHTQPADAPKKWENILQLYNRLLQIQYSPAAALNRTYALAKARGFSAAIIEAEKLQLSESHWYHALLSDLYFAVDKTKAETHLARAIALAKTEAEKSLLEKKRGRFRVA